jgi:hypothetical protein
MIPVDEQTGQPYEYTLIGQSAKAYQLCAEFNKATDQSQYNGVVYPNQTGATWSHPAGRYCFTESIPVSLYPQVPIVK